MSVRRARQLRKTATECERLMWRALRFMKKHGFHFRRQAPIGQYVADFACHSAKIIIELDGSQHYERGAMIRDRQRTVFLESRGYRVLRFSNFNAKSNVGGITDYILDQCKAHRPPPEALPR